MATNWTVVSARRARQDQVGGLGLAPLNNFSKLEAIGVVSLSHARHWGDSGEEK